VRDASVRSDHEEIPRVEVPANRSIQLADDLAGIAGKNSRVAGLLGPGRQRGVGVDADAEKDDVFAVVEERGVLITVRLSLDRSTARPRLDE
jgi:hypothetical protein